jgi:pre-mRNA-splicing factor ATP-dependent RNA helicase DHX38/PRP16
MNYSNLFDLQYDLFKKIYDIFLEYKNVSNIELKYNLDNIHKAIDYLDLNNSNRYKTIKTDFYNNLKNLKDNNKIYYNINEFIINNDINNPKILNIRGKKYDYMDYLIDKQFTLPMWNPVSIDKNSEFVKNLNILNSERKYINAVKLITEYLKNNDILILKSKTGSGKSVIIPQLLVNSNLNNNKKIVSTQPRRLNAESISKYVSTLMWTKLGNGVGYKHGGDKINSNTLMYMTEGSLIKETTNNLQKMINKYSIIIIDEVHERSIDTDILLALIKNINDNYKGKVKFIITSATFDSLKFGKFYGLLDDNKLSENLSIEDNEKLQQNILVVEGVSKSVKQTFLQKSSDNYIEDTCNCALYLHENYIDELNETERDILIFVDGSSTIRKMYQILTNKIIEKQKLNANFPPVAILTLTSQSNDDEKNKVIKNIYNNNNINIDVLSVASSLSPKRRIILATNTAETGITFDTLKHVIDTGWMNLSVYDVNTGSTALITSHITKDNSLQRQGRVGRVSDGFYWAMFTEKTYNKLKKHKIPSIYYENISLHLLDIITYINELYPSKGDIGVIDIYQFNFIDSPSINNVQRAVSELYLLGAIDDNLNITFTGNVMKKFLLPPKLSKVLFVSPYFGCSYEISIIIASMGKMSDVYLYSDNQYGNLTYFNYQSDHINSLITFLKYSQFKQNVKGNLSKIKSWCIINGLNYDLLNKIENEVNELLISMNKNNIPIISFYTNVFNDDKINNIIKALFTGLFLNTAIVQDHIKWFSITNPLNNKIIPAISYKSLFYTGNSKYKTIYPKDIIFTDLLLKNNNGIYTHYISEISPYKKEWFNNISPNPEKLINININN